MVFIYIIILRFVKELLVFIQLIIRLFSPYGRAPHFNLLVEKLWKLMIDIGHRVIMKDHHNNNRYSKQ